jgi:hypothetical protein
MIDDKEGKRRFFADVQVVPDHLLRCMASRRPLSMTSVSAKTLAAGRAK